MYKILGRLCAPSNVLAGGALGAIALIILAQIGARLIHKALPATDDLASWAMAAAVFLALPSAFFNGSHIRVTLGVDRLRRSGRRVLLRAGNTLALGLMLAGTWFVANYVWESFIYKDTSQGAIALPLWVPQISMLAGMVLSLPVLIVLAVTGEQSCAAPAEKDHSHDF